MQSVDYAWSKIYTVGIRVFLFFVAVALLFFLVGLFITNPELNLGYLLAKIFLLNGIIWLSISLFSLLKYRIVLKKLSSLKATGNPYEVKIKQMRPLWYVNLGGHVFATAVGQFTDSSGKIRNVKSVPYAFTTFDKQEDFVANVYVDAKNLESYAVELFRKA